MAPSPLVAGHQSKQDEASGDISCDFSSSASSFDDIDFDPDAVDFEPLLVSGTGKILSYHSSSYHEYEESMSGNSSLATPVAGNGIGEHPTPREDHLFKKTPSRFVQLLSLVILMVVAVVGGLSLFAVDANRNFAHHRLQTTVTKSSAGMGHHLNGNIDIDNILDQHINADLAVFEASVSETLVWEPFADPNDSLMRNLMAVMAHCFGRPIFQLQMDESGTYHLQRVSEQRGVVADSELATLLTKDVPMAAFTPHFRQAAVELYNPLHQGAFIAILHDPVDVFAKQYKEQQETMGIGDIPQKNDNLLVRSLSLVEDENHRVNDEDYEVARQVLRSKFVLGSCDDPTETLHRLMKMFGRTDIGSNNLIGSERCTKGRQGFNLLCRKMKQNGNQFRSSHDNTEIMSQIESYHRYDIMLYKESKEIFDEQKQLFE